MRISRSKLLLFVFLTNLIFLKSGLSQGSHGDVFTFVRIVYNAGGANYQLRNYMPPNFEFWSVDYPAAEENFMDGLRKWTTVDVSKSPVALSLLDTDLFRYPFAYIVEVGYMSLSQVEADSLGEWLLRGGFLMVDDFHGPFE